MSNNNQFEKQRENLNDIYKELNEDKNLILEALSVYDVNYAVGYYPFHSFKENNEFYLEQYPIPVISLNGFLDIGIDIDKIFFEFRFMREMAVDFDYSVFNDFRYEVYGVEDYYQDFYFDDIDEISSNIEMSNEVEVGISILINKENISEDLVKVLELLSNHLPGELV